jgi:hypothetical protein
VLLRRFASVWRKTVGLVISITKEWVGTAYLPGRRTDEERKQ